MQNDCFQKIVTECLDAVQKCQVGRVVLVGKTVLLREFTVRLPDEDVKELKFLFQKAEKTVASQFT